MKRLEVYSAKSTVIMRERMKLMREFLDLKVQIDDLETKEKWLLLTIALRGQPNLLYYLQETDRKTITKVPL